MKLDTENIIIYWKPRHWKTMFSVLLSYDYCEIYWNVKIKKHWKDISNIFNESRLFEKIPDCKVKWLCIIDEVWKNFNAKEFTTEKNRNFSNFRFTSWKKNISNICIWQKLSSIPVDQRELASLVYYVEKYYKKWYKYPLFTIRLQKLLPPDYREAVDLRVFTDNDLVSMLKSLEIEYNTKEDLFFNN